MPPEATAKAAAAARGKKHSPEWCANIKKALFASDKLKQASLAKRGKKFTDEHRRKISEANKARAGQPGAFAGGDACTPEMRRERRERMLRLRAAGIIPAKPNLGKKKVKSAV